MRHSRIKSINYLKADAAEVLAQSVRYEVLLTAGAERDLEAIYDHIAEFDCQVNADHVWTGSWRSSTACRDSRNGAATLRS